VPSSTANDREEEISMQAVATPEHRAACFVLWFPVHNNPRYAMLFPRLAHIVRFFKFTLSRNRIVRGVQYRMWQLLKRLLIYPLALRYLARRYRTLLTVDHWQILAWPHQGSIVVDADDPLYTATEVRLFNLPQVRAIVVTTTKAKTLFEQLGVTKEIHVIPQGVPVDGINPQGVAHLREQFKRNGEFVAGYHAPTLTLLSDGPKRARGGMDDLDLLLAAAEHARRKNPSIVLWLVGTPSDGLQQYADRKPWIRLLGYVPVSGILDYVSAFDVGVYPRTWSPPPGRFSVKIAQFMACGLPIISTPVDESFIVTEAECGMVCKTSEDFGEGLVTLAGSAERRQALGHAARRYAEKHLDWSVLMRDYEALLKD